MIQSFDRQGGASVNDALAPAARPLALWQLREAVRAFARSRRRDLLPTTHHYQFGRVFGALDLAHTIGVITRPDFLRWSKRLQRVNRAAIRRR